MTISMQKLSLVEQTALFPVYYRALESQRPDGLIKDPKAVALIEKIDFNFSKLKTRQFVQVALILRVRQFDLLTRDFLTRNPDGIVVYAGCGLDTAFDRVDNGQVEWYDLDLPEVIEVRRQFLPETQRSRLIGCSVLDPTWMDRIRKPAGRSLLVRAEAVLPYLSGKDVKGMVLAIADRFPGTELICDTISPLVVKIQNFEFLLSGMKVRLQWGLSNGHELETWHPGFALLSEWNHFNQAEPRLGWARLFRFLPMFGKGARVLHYRLGN